MTSTGRQRTDPWACFARALIVLLCSLVLVPGLVTSPVHASAPAAQAAAAYSNGTLLRDQSNGRIYLYWNGTRHWIIDPPTLDALGYANTSWVPLTSSQIAAIPDGSTLEVDTVAGFVDPLAPITSSQVSLALNKPSVAPGHSLRLSGSGFAANEDVTIDAPNLSFTVAADASGDFSDTVPVPSSVSLGLHHIFVQGATSGDFGVEVIHVVASPAAQLTLASPQVQIGTSAGISGTGFLAGEHVQVFAGTLNAIEATADGSGNLGLVNVPVPSSDQAGSVTVLAFGESSSRFALSTLSLVTNQVTTPTSSPTPTSTPTPTPTSTATSTAAPMATATPTTAPASGPARISLNLARARRGSLVHISGYGFLPRESVRIRFRGRLLQVTLTNDDGAFHNVKFNVPNDAQPGIAMVTATGTQSGRVASGAFDVLPAVRPHIQVSPSTVFRGSLLAVSGGGFFGTERVVLRLGSTVVLVTATNPSGNVSVSFRVPASWPRGEFTIRAQGMESGFVATVSVKVAVRVTVSATSGYTVFEGGLRNGWRDAAFGFSSKDSCDTRTFVTGPCSFSIAYTAWGGIQFMSPSPFAVSAFRTVSYYLNPNGKPIRDFAVLFLDTGGNVIREQTLSSANVIGATGNGFEHVSVPVSVLDPSGVAIKEIQLKNATDDRLSTIYVDNVQLMS